MNIDTWCPLASFPFPTYHSSGTRGILAFTALNNELGAWYILGPRACGRLAQRESAAFTRQRSLVRTQHRPLKKSGYLQAKREATMKTPVNIWGLVQQPCSNANHNKDTLANTLLLVRLIGCGLSISRGTIRSGFLGAGDKEARTLRELSETMVEFWDEGEHQRDHEVFKGWQRRNKYGYVLNVLPDQTRVPQIAVHTY